MPARHPADPGASARVLAARLATHRLAGPLSSSAPDAVTWLGAAQAQEYGDSKWSIGLRTRHSSDNSIEKALDRGEILRTHALRPTWHYVSPDSIRWMLELTAPRVKARLAPYDRRMEITPTTIAKSQATIARSIRAAGPLTRAEIKAELRRVGISTDVQRLAHLVMHAELDGIVCSGPRRGAQATYALLDERAPQQSRLSRDEALARLGRSYFDSHGPAQARDFAWWSGLTMADARQAIGANKAALIASTIHGKTYWTPRRPLRRRRSAPSVLLVSVYDEYTIAYADRSDLGDAHDAKRLAAWGNALTHLILSDGRIVGAWKRTTRRGTIEVSLRPLRPLRPDERDAAEAQVDRYGRFFGRPAALVR